MQNLDAKYLLGPKGPLVPILGKNLNFGRIARGMRLDELHEDVHALLGLAREGLGLMETTVIRRKPL